MAGKFVQKTWINKRRAFVKAAAAATSAQKPLDHETAIANLSDKAKKDRVGTVDWFKSLLTQCHETHPAHVRK